MSVLNPIFSQEARKKKSGCTASRLWWWYFLWHQTGKGPEVKKNPLKSVFEKERNMTLIKLDIQTIVQEDRFLTSWLRLLLLIHKEYSRSLLEPLFHQIFFEIWNLGFLTFCLCTRPLFLTKAFLPPLPTRFLCLVVAIPVVCWYTCVLVCIPLYVRVKICN